MKQSLLLFFGSIRLSTYCSFWWKNKKEKCKDIWQGDFLSNQTDGVRRSFLKEAHTHKRKQLGTTSQKYFTFKMEICPVSGTIQIQCSKYKPLILKKKV